MQKIGQVGVWTRSRDLFLNFGTPSISGTDKVRNFKFGVRVDRPAYRPTNAKLGQKGRGLRHVTYVTYF